VVWCKAFVPLKDILFCFMYNYYLLSIMFVYKVVSGNVEELFFCKNAAIRQLFILYLTVSNEPQYPCRYPIYLSTYTEHVEGEKAKETRRETVDRKALIDMIMTATVVAGDNTECMLLSEIPFGST
jgi:hypothetical protein